MPKGQKKGVKLLVLDVLKPHSPNIVDFGKEIAKTDNVENADITVYAVDEKTENVKVVLEGSNLDFEIIRKTIENFGAVVHSVDKIGIGRTLCMYQLPEPGHPHKAFEIK